MVSWYVHTYMPLKVGHQPRGQQLAGRRPLWHFAAIRMKWKQSSLTFSGVTKVRTSALALSLVDLSYVEINDSFPTYL